MTIKKYATIEQIFDCSGVKEVDFSGTTVEDYANLKQMFDVASSLETLDMSDMTIGKNCNLDALLSSGGNSKIKRIDLSNTVVGDGSSLGFAYSQGCPYLTDVNLENLTLGKSVNAYTWSAGVFQNCPQLTSVDLTTVTFGDGTDARNMFRYCNNLRELKIVSAESSLSVGENVKMDM